MEPLRCSTDSNFCHDSLSAPENRRPRTGQTGRNRQSSSLQQRNDAFTTSAAGNTGGARALSSYGATSAPSSALSSHGAARTAAPRPAVRQAIDNYFLGDGANRGRASSPGTGFASSYTQFLISREEKGAEAAAAVGARSPLRAPPRSRTSSTRSPRTSGAPPSSRATSTAARSSRPGARPCGGPSSCLCGTK